jgi:hypothetical protein
VQPVYGTRTRCQARLFKVGTIAPRLTYAKRRSKGRGVWTMFERLLEPGCTESPDCQCGGEMQIEAIEKLPQGSDAAVRVYRCDECQREMRLTVWAAPPLQANGHVFSEA